MTTIPGRVPTLDGWYIVSRIPKFCVSRTCALCKKSAWCNITGSLVNVKRKTLLVLPCATELQHFSVSAELGCFTVWLCQFHARQHCQAASSRRGLMYWSSLACATTQQIHSGRCEIRNPAALVDVALVLQGDRDHRCRKQQKTKRATLSPLWKSEEQEERRIKITRTRSGDSGETNHTPLHNPQVPGRGAFGSIG